MDELLSLLRGVKPTIDFEHEENLIDSGLLDSLDIAAIISAVEDHFGIELDGSDVDADNFSSITAIRTMIEKYLR